MTYEECNWLSGLNQKRRGKICRRAWMLDQAIRWGGWLVEGVSLLVHVL